MAAGRGTTGIMRNRNYLLLLVGQSVSSVGNSCFPLALYWFTLNVTHSRADLGFVATLTSLASLAGLVSGAFVDRWDRRRTMIWSDVTRAALTLILAIIAYAGQLSFLVLALFALALGLVSTVFQPASMALLPNIVGMEEIGPASGMNQGAGAAANLIGTSLGGFLMGLFGPALLILLDCLTFVVSFGSIGMLRLGRCDTEAPAVALSDAEAMGAVRRFVADVLEGQRTIWRSPYLARFVLVAMIVNFAFVPLSFLDVAWVREVLHLGAFAYGLFGGGTVLGVITGSLIVGRLMRRFRLQEIVMGSILLLGAAVAAFSRVPSFVPDLCILFVMGIGLGVVNPAVFTAIQRDTPPALMGRVAGSVMALVQVATPVGAMAAGLLAAVLPLGIIFLASGCLAMLAAGLLVGVRAPVEGLVAHAAQEAN